MDHMKIILFLILMISASTHAMKSDFNVGRVRSKIRKIRLKEKRSKLVNVFERPAFDYYMIDSLKEVWNSKRGHISPRAFYILNFMGRYAEYAPLIRWAQEKYDSMYWSTPEPDQPEDDYPIQEASTVQSPEALPLELDKSFFDIIPLLVNSINKEEEGIK